MKMSRRFVLAYCGLYLAHCVVVLVSYSNVAHGSPPAASDLAKARHDVVTWLDEQPRQPRDEPPSDDFPELTRKWIERGKRIPRGEDVLIEILKDKTSRQRATAALVVGRIGGFKSLDALEDVFETDDPRLQLNAIESIRVIDSPKRVDVLATALKSTYAKPEAADSGVPTRKAIIRANIGLVLSEMKEESAKHLLTRLLSSESDPYVLDALRSVKNMR